jgi:VWFA-related protein
MTLLFRTGCAAALVLAGIGSLAADRAPTPQGSQEKRPAFRSAVDTVVLDVSVLDRDRRPVRGLTAADFTVFEDGKLQTLATFSPVDLPDVEQGSVSWVRDVVPEVQSNQDARERRVVVIVLDDATPMPAVEVPRVKELARQFINRLSAADLAAVVFTLHSRSGQDFTHDRARLLKAADTFNGSIAQEWDTMKSQPLPSPSRNSRTTEAPDPSGPTRLRFDEFDPNALTLYQATVGTLEGVSAQLAALPERRKALVLISVGLPFDPDELGVRQGLSDGNNSGEMAWKLKERMEAAFRAAQQANVNIYSVDPGGLRAGMPANMTKSARPVGDLNQEFLRTVSENTGGFAVTDNNDLEHGLAQILLENGSYYLLGYQSPNQRAGGKFRRVEVRVNRPGVTVRSRSGYYEPVAGGAVERKTAPTPVAALLPKADLSMQLWASAFAAPGKSGGSVAIVLGMEQPPLEGSSAAVDNVDVRSVAFDEKGASRASERITFRLNVGPGTGQDVSYQVLSRLDVPPGHYQVRIGADSSLRAKNGSVYCDIDVPDFAKEPVSMSGVAISAAPAPVSAPADRFSSLLPAVPTTQREFGSDQAVSAFVRLYQGGSAQAGPLVVAATIVDSRGGVVFERSETIGAARFGADRAAEYRLDLPIERLQPGLHLLTIETSLGQKRVRREVRFAVR